MTDHPDVLVVGYGPAAHRLVERLRHHGHTGALTVLGASTEPAHQRELLPAALAGPLPRPALTLPAPPADVTVALGVRAARLDRGRRVVVDDAGREHRYDHLALATGATGRDPGFVPGPGARTLRSLDDLDALATVGGDVVVVGGGRSGVEIALALARRDPGARVDLVDPHAHPLARHLDPTVGAVVTATLAGAGVTVLAGRRAVAHRPGELDLRDEHDPGGAVETVGAPTVVLATGTVPRRALAAASGLLVGRGVRVDDRLTTADPRVHALGAAAEPPGGPGVDVAAAHAQAEVLARRLTGADARHRAPRRVTRLRFGDLDVLALGYGDDAPVEETVTVADPAGTRHARLELAGGRIVRAVAVGFPAASGPLVQHWRADRPLPAARLALLLGTPTAEGGADLAVLPRDAIVCSCNSVTRGAIEQARYEGADDVDAIAAATRATTGCGSCRATVCGLLEVLAGQEVPA